MAENEHGQEIYQRTRRFALQIIMLYQKLERSSVGRIIGNQCLRSGTSIGANIAEAQAGQSRADFIAKMSIALKEAHETRSWLSLIDDAQILPKEDIQSLTSEINQIIKVVFTIIQRSRPQKS